MMKRWRNLGEPALEEREITITVTEEEAVRFQQAAEEVPSLLHHAGAVFRMLWSMEAGGYAKGQTGIVSLYELCARAFEDAARKEGEAVSSLDWRLRTAIALLREEQKAEQEKTRAEQDRQRLEQVEAELRRHGVSAARKPKPDDTGA